MVGCRHHRRIPSILRYVVDRIKKNIDAQNDSIENREERLGSHTPKTVGGPKVRSASESIVEPYRETVMAMVKSGGNHRTIYPVIQEMGYTGSRNAIYQYILKLRKEVPDQLNRKLTEMPPEMTLESYPRDKIYSAILKEASIGRPGNEENSEQDTKSETKKKTPKANNSPFSAKVTELILGPEKEISEEKEKPKKKPTLP